MSERDPDPFPEITVAVDRFKRELSIAAAEGFSQTKRVILEQGERNLQALQRIDEKLKKMIEKMN